MPACVRRRKPAGAKRAAREGGDGEHGATAGEKQRQAASAALLPELPGLLRKLQASPAQASWPHLLTRSPLARPLAHSLTGIPTQVAALAACVPELGLGLYALQRRERAFSALLGVLGDVVLKSGDEQVLCWAVLGCEM